MQRIMVGLGLAAAFAAGPALAAGEAGVTAVVNQYAHDFVVGDFKAGAALCAPSASIIDDFAPHAWSGPTACADWAKSVVENFRRGKITDGKVSLGKAYQVTVEGDVAYGVYPAVFNYKDHGKPGTERGVWTFAMRKTGGAWRITAWSWGGTK